MEQLDAAPVLALPTVSEVSLREVLMAKALPKAVLAFMPTGSVCLTAPVAAIAETNMKDQLLGLLPIPSPTTLEEAVPPPLEPPPVAPHPIEPPM